MSLHYKKDRVYFSLKNRLCTGKNNFLETYFDWSVSQDAYEYKKNYGGWHNTLSTGFIFCLGLILEKHHCCHVFSGSD